jgi:hypothetical protein
LKHPHLSKNIRQHQHQLDSIKNDEEFRGLPSRQVRALPFQFQMVEGCRRHQISTIDAISLGICSLDEDLSTGARLDGFVQDFHILIVLTSTVLHLKFAQASELSELRLRLGGFFKGFW